LACSPDKRLRATAAACTPRPCFVDTVEITDTTGLEHATAMWPAARVLTTADVAAAVRFVVAFPARGCPTQIRLQPQCDGADHDH